MPLRTQHPYVLKDPNIRLCTVVESRGYPHYLTAFQVSFSKGHIATWIAIFGFNNNKKVPKDYETAAIMTSCIGYTTISLQFRVKLSMPSV